MKTIRMLLSAGLALNLMILSVSAMLDPATVYCKELGYGYEVTQTPEGESGICKLPDSSTCEEWAFLKGKCGQDYSYCRINGYGIETVSDPDICAPIMDMDCGVCVLSDGSKVEITKLMNLNTKEGVCGDGRCVLGENYASCPKDCPSGSFDGYCDGITDGKCDPDCEAGLDPDCVTSSTIESVTTVTEEMLTTTLMATTTTVQSTTTSTIPETSCGNGLCGVDENHGNCPQDCPSGSKDGYCDWIKDGTCDPDCETGQDPDCAKGASPFDYLPYAVALVIIIIAVAYFINKKREEKRIEKEREEFVKWKAAQERK